MKHYRNLISLTLLFFALGAATVFGGDPEESAQLAKSLGISFSSAAGSTLILERDGKRYQIDVAAKTV
jgi:hypothetical protein